MNTKIPKFDEALGKILDNLEPCKKDCKECQKEFAIMAEDIEFYKKLQVPSPTLCWECRLQRRLGYRPNLVPTFYKKTCSAPGHTEKVISVFSEDNSVKVYDDKYYWSDNWEATEFAVGFYLEEDFFSQCKKFALTVPHQTLYKDPVSVDSDYVILGVSAKNCYFVALPYLSENIYYGHLPVKCKDGILLNACQECEKCFDDSGLQRCYTCISCVESSDCIDSSFLYDCKNCSNCFMSSNLRNKQYYFYNKKLNKKEYENRIITINLGKRTVYNKLQNEFKMMMDRTIKKNAINIKVENVIGDSNYSAKNCFNSFGLIGGSENNRYCFLADNVTDSIDLSGAVKSTKLYNTTAIFCGNNIVCSNLCRVGINLEYCSECNNCENCFACFGLKNKKYHIFNKSYSEEKYWQKVDEIKTKMLERGEYGEFFPLKDSPFPYQDSNAQVEFPLTEEAIKDKGWHWQDEVKSDIDLAKVNILKGDDVPDDIKSVDNNILKTAIICQRTNKPFKITKFELDFYRKMNVPLPIISPTERIKDLLKYRRFYKLYDSKCDKCQKDIQTVHNPEKTKNIYCEKCYNEVVA